MDATPLSYHVAPPRPELGPLLAMLAVLTDRHGAVVLHVTAARAGEGTTTIARELAAAAAQAPWCRVALIEAAGSQPGVLLPALIDGSGQMRPVRLPGAGIALAALVAPGAPPPPMDAVREALAWLRSQFTLVVVDGPPVLTSRQGAVLAGMAQGTLLVVEAERARLADTRQARGILENLGASILGVVLNKRRQHVPRFVERRL